MPQSGNPWQPNYKFKVHDKEHEFDKFVHGVIKTPEEEKRLREVYEKAYGLDVVKPKYQKAQSDYQSLNGKHESLISELKQVGDAVRSGDLDTAFKSLNISEDTVYKWVKAKLDEAEMPEHQRQMLNEQRQQAKQAQLLAKENETLRSNWENAQIDMRQRELDLSLGSPSVSPIMSAFDAKFGQGSFMQEVIMTGAMANQMGKDPSAQELVQQVVAKYGPLLTPQSAVQASQPGTQQSQAARSASLPNIKGSSTTATKAKPRSLADLKKLADSME